MRAIADRFAPGEAARAALAAGVDALLVCSRADLRDEVLAALESAAGSAARGGPWKDGGVQARLRRRAPRRRRRPALRRAPRARDAARLRPIGYPAGRRCSRAPRRRDPGGSPMSAAPHVNQLEKLDRELETILTSFDTNYVWNYGSVKEGLRDLYEKAKRDQWNSTTQLAWDDRRRSRGRDHPRRPQPAPGLRALPEARREGARAPAPRADLAPALAVPARRAGRADRRLAARGRRAVDRRQVLRRHPDDGRGAPRRGVQPLPAREARVGVADQRQPEGAARRDHPGLPLGLQVPRHADHHRGPGDGRLRQPVPGRPGAAAEGAAPLRDEGRVAPRGLRRALAPGLLQGHARAASCATARTS